MKHSSAGLAFAFAILLSTALAQTNSFTCPGNNGQEVTDALGVQYVIGCGNDTTVSSFTSSSATSSFNDCFGVCSNNTLGFCTAFTYVGGTNGVGGGTCYLKNGGSEGFTVSASNVVGAIKAPYDTLFNFHGPAFTCPADNNTLVTDPSGAQYIIGCNDDTSSGSFASYATGVSFDDCFYNCSNNVFASGTPYGCVAFTYVGGANGVGSGTCYYKTYSAPGTEVFSYNAGTNLVGAIRYNAYSGPAPSSTLLPSSASTSTAAIASTGSASVPTTSSSVAAGATTPAASTANGAVTVTQYVTATATTLSSIVKTVTATTSAFSTISVTATTSLAGGTIATSGAQPTFTEVVVVFQPQIERAVSSSAAA